jgi:hypothetical protein
LLAGTGSGLLGLGTVSPLLGGTLIGLGTVSPLLGGTLIGFAMIKNGIVFYYLNFFILTTLKLLIYSSLYRHIEPNQ